MNRTLATLIAAASVTHAALRCQDERVDAIRAEFRASTGGDVPAAALAIVVDGRALFAEVAGTARLSEDVVADDMTLFPMGEATRVITGLLLADLERTNSIDLDKNANDYLGSLALRNADGSRASASVRDIVMGKARTPYYRNLLRRDELERWPLERALRENCWILPDRTGSRCALAWAIAQRAVEGATGATWAEAVKNRVQEPLRLASFRADLRSGRPANSVDGHRRARPEGVVIEERIWSNFIADSGAWITARDLARLLRTLASLCESEVEGERAVQTALQRMEFADFLPNQWGGHWSLRHTSGSAGSSSAIRIYPDQRVAWAYLSNQKRYGMPASLLESLREKLLPEPLAIEDGAFSSELAPARGRTEVDESRVGRWKGAVRVHGEDVRVHMQVGGYGVRKFVVAEKTPATITTTDSAGGGLQANGKSLGLVRPDVQKRWTLDLAFDQDADAYQGHIKLLGTYCGMTFPVAFKRDKQ